MKEAKLSTRKILASSTLDETFWPVAAKAAASMQRARVLRQVPRMATAFGAKVLVKKRRHAASGALIRLEFDERWDDGVYLGLSDQVSDGHLVYVDGVFTHTKNVRDKAKLTDAGTHRDEGGEQPGGPLGFEPEGISPSVSRRRIVGKSAPRVAVLEGHEEAYDDDLVSDRGEMSDLEEDEEEQDLGKNVMPPRVAVLGVRAGHNGGVVIEQSEEVLDPEDYAKEILYEEEEIDEAVVKRLFDLLPNQRFPRVTADSEVIKMRQKAWASGVYRHGGVLGLRNSSKGFPYSTRLINLYIQKKLGLDATCP